MSKTPMPTARYGTAPCSSRRIRSPVVQQQRIAAARELAMAILPLLRQHFPGHRLAAETERLLASLPE